MKKEHANYGTVVEFVRAKGFANFRTIYKGFNYRISPITINTYLKHMKKEGIIADNPEGWLCEVFKKLN